MGRLHSCGRDDGGVSSSTRSVWPTHQQQQPVGQMQLPHLAWSGWKRCCRSTCRLQRSQPVRACGQEGNPEQAVRAGAVRWATTLPGRGTVCTVNTASRVLGAADVHLRHLLKLVSMHTCPSTTVHNSSVSGSHQEIRHLVARAVKGQQAGARRNGCRRGVGCEAGHFTAGGTHLWGAQAPELACTGQWKISGGSAQVSMHTQNQSDGGMGK